VISFTPGPAEAIPEPRAPVAYAHVRKVHLMGIGGSAMGAFAGMLKERGLEVRGSDENVYSPMRERLAEWGIPYVEGYRAENLDWGPDLVIVGNVIRRVNPEAEATRVRGLPHVSFPEALGEWILPGRLPVVIVGTHGKTTTTSLMAWVLTVAGHAPGLLVGGVPFNIGRSFASGGAAPFAWRSPYGPEHLFEAGAPFVIEGDEYDTAYFDKRPKFVHYRPHHAILTSVEFDHADIYPDEAACERAFALLSSLVAPEGLLCAWGQDDRVLRAARHATSRVFTYGLGPASGLDVEARIESLDGAGACYEVFIRGTSFGRIRTPMAGRHNVLNATAVIATAADMGVPYPRVAEAMESFQGVRKRQDVRGEEDGVLVIDDYAHHPTAVRETIDAIRARYPGRRLWAAFEAESNTSRRRAFQDLYPTVFDGADLVVFCKPLAKASDKLKPEEQIDVPAIITALHARGKQAWYLPEVPEIVRFMAETCVPGDVVLGMSGRHFEGLHDALLAALRARASRPT
jgi:UDP-N-acetylmuramate: L-alanyl-gamma-D-glutamyl-meso-diaminopimelate ligase